MSQKNKDKMLTTHPQGYRSLKKDITHFAHYKIISILGEGGMGRVYKAWDTKLNRVVALKILLHERFGSPKLLQRFFLEGQATAKLDHPSLIKILEFGKEHNVPYFTMNYIEGSTLADVIENQKISIRQAVIWMKKIAQAIHHAHSVGIIHRDLKPHNILIDRLGEPIIMDFGVAKILRSDFQITHSGEVIGTPYYMAPEQAEGKRRMIDARTDVYSLGIILYELLTKELPFSGTTVAEILQAVIFSNPVMPSEIIANLPKDLETICLKAIEKKPEKRYQSANDFAQDLQNFLDGKKIKARKSFAVYSMDKKMRRIMLTAGICIVVAVTWGIVQTVIGKKAEQQTTIQSLHDIEMWVQQHPSAEGSYSYAQSLIKQGFYERAKIQLLKTLELWQPGPIDKHEVLKDLIIVLVELNSYEEAISHFRNLPRKHPDLIFYIGIAYYYQQQFDIAQQLFTEHLAKTSVASQKVVANYYLGMTFFKKNLLNEAIENFLQVEKDFVSLTTIKLEQVFFSMGVCYFQQKNLIQAKKYLEKAAQQIQDEAQIYEYLGKIAVLQNDLDVSLQYFSRCIELQPYNSHYHVLLGKSQYDTKQYFQADQMFQRGLQLDPKNFEALEWMFKVSFKEVSLQRDRYYLLKSHFNQSNYLVAPELFVDEVRKITYQYEKDDDFSTSQWQQSPEYFLRLLAESESYKAQETAIQALVSMRYHPELENALRNFLVKQSAQATKRVQNAWSKIRERKNREQNEKLYFQISRFYLQEDFQIRKSLEKPENQSKLKEMLQNSEENEFLRYLAARALLETLSFTTIEDGMAAENFTQRLICCCVLREKGFPVGEEVLESALELELSPFLGTLVARNFPRCNQKIAQHFLKFSDLTKLAIAATMIDNGLYSDGRQVLLSFLDAPQENYRKFAYYHLWNSFILSKEPIDLYASFFNKGLKDSCREVMLVSLQFAQILNASVCLPELIQIAKQSDDPMLRLMAIIGIYMNQPGHPFIEEQIFNPQENFLIRLYAAGGSFFIEMVVQNDTPEVKVRNMTKWIGRIPRYVADDNLYFKAGAAALLANARLYPKGFFKEDGQLDFLACAFMTLDREPPGIAPFFSFDSLSFTEKQKLVQKYLKHEYDNIRKAAYAAHIRFLTSIQRTKIYQELRKSSDLSVKEGAAIGFHEVLKNSIESKPSKLPRFQIYKRSLKSKIIAIDIEENYHGYIYLLKNSNNHEKYFYIELLNQAIDLAKYPEFYYERAVLYKSMGKEELATQDLEEAVKLKGNSIRYLLELAHSLRNSPQKAEPLLQKAFSLSRDSDVLWYMKEQLYDLREMPIVQKIFKRFCLVYQHGVTYFEWAKTLSVMEDSQGAIKYLQYIQKKNIFLHHSQIWNQWEFKKIRNHPWVNSLPR